MKQIINKSDLLILIVFMSCKPTTEADWTSPEGFIWKSETWQKYIKGIFCLTND